jgi:predicted  nucleic acid-binding Zn-ribbon protein
VIRIVETLLEMQRIELESRRLTPEQKEQTGKLRAQIPAAVLERFDRWVGRGKKAVAIVRNGVCCECHLRLPSGTLAALAYTTDIHYCDNCTRILYLPENEPLGLTKGAPSVPAAVEPTAKRPRTRASSRVV